MLSLLNSVHAITSCFCVIKLNVVLSCLFSKWGNFFKGFRPKLYINVALFFPMRATCSAYLPLTVRLPAGETISRPTVPGIFSLLWNRKFFTVFTKSHKSGPRLCEISWQVRHYSVALLTLRHSRPPHVWRTTPFRLSSTPLPGRSKMNVLFQ